MWSRPCEFLARTVFPYLAVTDRARTELANRAWNRLGIACGWQELQITLQRQVNGCAGRLARVKSVDLYWVRFHHDRWLDPGRGLPVLNSVVVADFTLAAIEELFRPVVGVLDWLAGAASLHTLTLHRCRLPPARFPALTLSHPLPGIKVLSFRPLVGDGGHVTLSWFPNVEELDLQGDHVTWAELGCLRRLRKLHITCADVGDEHLLAAQAMSPDLTWLSLHCCRKVTPDVVGALSSTETKIQLSVSRCRVAVASCNLFF